jgi:hypothetical protein
MPTGHTGTIIDITVTGIIDIGGELSRIKKRKFGYRPLAPCGTLPKTSHRGTNVDLETLARSRRSNWFGSCCVEGDTPLLTKTGVS